MAKKKQKGESGERDGGEKRRGPENAQRANGEAAAGDSRRQGKVGFSLAVSGASCLSGELRNLAGWQEGVEVSSVKSSLFCSFERSAPPYLAVTFCGAPKDGSRTRLPRFLSARFRKRLERSITISAGCGDLFTPRVADVGLLS